MTEKYRVHELGKFNYSDIGEYIDENHTDRPLRNDILVDLLNELSEENTMLKKANLNLRDNNTDLRRENEQLKQTYQRLKHRHSLLHDVCIEAECDRDGYHKDVVSLEKENEQLKHKVNGLKSELTIWKEDANEHIQETNKLFEENKQLKEELESFEEVNFTDLCDGSRTILYMKKENVGDSE